MYGPKVELWANYVKSALTLEWRFIMIPLYSVCVCVRACVRACVCVRVRVCVRACVRVRVAEYGVVRMQIYCT